MRCLLFFFFLAPCFSFAQAQADYEYVAGKFVSFYNNTQPDSLVNLWSADDKDGKSATWNYASLKMLHNEYGNIESYKYIGMNTSDRTSGLAVFKIQFTKAGQKAMSLTLGKGNYIETFRFITSSPEIEKMLKESK